MRRFATAFLLLTSISNLSYAAKGCPGDDYLKLTTGRFNICLPLQTFKNAIIGPFGLGVLVKFADGKSFSAEIITPEMDSMPATYDMRLYPEEILGLQTPSNLTPKQAEILSNTRAVMEFRYGDTPPIKYKSKGKTFYTISKGIDPETQASGEAYVSIDDAKDQILLFNFGKMDEQSMKTILGGVQ